MELTKKSKEDLYNRYNGCGVVFVKTSGIEVRIIEFNLGRNGKLYTMGGTRLAARLDEISDIIEVEE